GTADTELDELRVPADRVERRAQLMTHRGEKLRLGAARRLHRRQPTRVPHRPLLGLFPFGQVARDLAIAHEPSTRVAERRNDDVGPEARAVFPDAPTLILEPSLTRRNLQLPRRFPSLDVLSRIKGREVTTDDLLLTVSLDAPRTLVPRLDVPLRIEHEDGVVSDVLNDQTEALLALTKLVLGFVPLR